MKIREEKEKNKKNVHLKKKLSNQVYILPLKSEEENIQLLEQYVSEIIFELILKNKEKFSFPIRINDIQRDYQLKLQDIEPPIFIILR